MEKRYEKDPINGKFYEVKEKGFTDAEWQEFQERWGQVANKHKYSFADIQVNGAKQSLFCGHQKFLMLYISQMNCCLLKICRLGHSLTNTNPQGG